MAGIISDQRASDNKTSNFAVDFLKKSRERQELRKSGKDSKLKKKVRKTVAQAILGPVKGATVSGFLENN